MARRDAANVVERGQRFVGLGNDLASPIQESSLDPVDLTQPVKGNEIDGNCDRVSRVVLLRRNLHALNGYFANGLGDRELTVDSASSDDASISLAIDDVGLGPDQFSQPRGNKGIG